MVGWLLVADELPERWGTIGEAMLTLFVMLTARELERRRRIGIGDQPDIAPAPVAERIAMLRAALTALEDELRLPAREGSDRGSR